MAAAGAASAAGVYSWTGGSDALISKILDRRLPGAHIDKASLVALSRDVQASRFHSFARKLGLRGAASAASIIGIDALAQFKLTATQFAQLERLVVTLFILGSDFLVVENPKVDLVTYIGVPDFCANPFARYD